MWNKMRPILKLYYHMVLRFVKGYRRIGLKNCNFSIVSNNCSGGYVYQYFGIDYKSPTAGLYFTTADFIRLVSSPKHYFSQPVHFISPSQSLLFGGGGQNVTFPIGKLDDIEIYFLHYPTQEEALDKWNRRTARINMDKLFFLLTENSFMTEELLAEFDSIPVASGHKICLTFREYPYTSIKQIKGISTDGWPPEVVVNAVNWKNILNNL